MNDIAKKAIEYIEKYKIPVFPANPALTKEQGAKAPLIPEVIPYRTKLPTIQEVKVWWTKHPNALIAGITGKVSNLIVLDADNKEGEDKINELIPDSLEVPCVTTPGGGKHFYFQYRDGLSNDSKSIFHIRTEGAYIILPGSVRADGRCYVLNNGCKIEDRPILPDTILQYIKSLFLSFTQGVVSSKGDAPVELFGDLHKDEGLFHTAYCLAKGGMPEYEIEQVLEKVMESWGEGDKKKWRKDKIQSAFKRLNTREGRLSQEVEDYVVTTTGNFLTTDVHKNLDLTTRDHKKNVTMILKRLCDKGIIEKYGDRNGSWRKIDRSLNVQCWWEAKGLPLDIKFPLEIEKFAKIFSGNTILLEGQKSQGKSAFALEFCRLNKRLFKQKILYQNVEMSDDELLDRFVSYGEVMTPEDWRESVTFIRQTSEWWDKIEPDGLNVVDYLIEYEKSYMVADFVWRIHQKLKSGIALILVQRDPFKPYPKGGLGVRDIPRLIISLMHHKIKLEDVKSFHTIPQGNPTGLQRKYKQANWWKFVPSEDWHLEQDEKYRDFLKGGQD